MNKITDCFDIFQPIIKIIECDNQIFLRNLRYYLSLSLVLSPFFRTHPKFFLKNIYWQIRMRLLWKIEKKNYWIYCVGQSPMFFKTYPKMQNPCWHCFQQDLLHKFEKFVVIFIALLDVKLILNIFLFNTFLNSRFETKYKPAKLKL